MKRSWLWTGLLAATAASTLFIIEPANAQQTPLPGPVAEDADRPEPPRAGRPTGPNPLELASRLSAAETYLGITPDQLSAWRGYTTALLALLDDHPGRKDGHGPKPQGKPGPRPAEDASPHEPGLFGDRLADDILAAAENARALKQAIATLAPLLTPAQTEKLGDVQHALLPPPPPPGRFGPGEAQRPDGPPHD